MNNVKGFSLIELMIVVAIIGIVGAIAMPSYDSYMLKSRRADDGLVHLSKIVDRQERFYLQNNIYTDSFDADGLNMTNSNVSDDGFYEFEITLTGTPVGQAFSVTATPVTGLAQERDTDCTSMTINSVGQKSATGDDPDKCW
jgi:type IV pilus assembly protein PilE